MTGNEIAALIVAVGGALGAIFAGIRNLRGDKFKHDVEASAALLSGYTGMVQTLQAQIHAIEERHSRERAEWFKEKAAMREQHSAEVRELNERIDELGTQLWVIQNRAITEKTRSTDHDRL